MIKHQAIQYLKHIIKCTFTKVLIDESSAELINVEKEKVKEYLECINDIKKLSVKKVAGDNAKSTGKEER